jgi:adenine-specific DNA-methyltransferase
VLNQIITGDARELAKSIPDDSVDLILADPIYENVEDYRWLAETAMRVLKPNSACLAFSSQRWVAKSQIAMEETGLNYLYTLQYIIPGKPGALHLYGLYPCATPCLLFAKGRTKASPYLPDALVSSDNPDNAFKWQKNIKLVSRWLTSFSKPGDIVYDPFAGSGTVPAVCKMTGRNFIASEIDPERAEKARRRVEMTPLPLFVLEQEEQQRMAI